MDRCTHPDTGGVNRPGRVRIPRRSSCARTHEGKLRIAVLSDALEDRNGVDAYYRDLVEHLAQWGHTVEFMQPARTGSARLLSMPMPGDPKQRICFPNPVVLSRRMRALRPQVILVATPGPFGLYGLYAARRLNARLIAGFHTHLEGLAGLYWSRILGGAGGCYVALLNRLLFRHAEITVVNAEAMMERARRLGAAEVALLGTPLGRRFLETPLKPLGPKVRHVLFAGRLAPEKNLEDVVEAAARLPHIHFSVAGDGPLGEWVARRARELPNLTHLAGPATPPARRHRVPARGRAPVPAHRRDRGPGAALSPLVR